MAASSVRIRIDSKLLNKLFACAHGLVEFSVAHPKGVVLKTEEDMFNAMQSMRPSLVGWFIRHVFPARLANICDTAMDMTNVANLSTPDEGTKQRRISRTQRAMARLLWPEMVKIEKRRHRA